MPSASVSVANTARMRAGGEELLDDLAEQRQHAGVVGGEPARQPLDEVQVAEHRQVLVGQALDPLLDVAPDAQPLTVGDEADVRQRAAG